MASSSPTPLLIGHRGAPGYRPEHTASSYELALSMGVDAVEPDLVVSRDGVLVIRHENEISSTTDVADRPEFADRRTRKLIAGVETDGWFAEDFLWSELRTLRCRERLPELRRASARHDGEEPILRLRDLLVLVDEHRDASGRDIAVVIEMKHAHYFAQFGIDLAALVLADLAAAGWEGHPERVIMESFELGVLGRLRDAGLDSPCIFLLEHAGSPADEEELPLAGTRYDWYRSEAGLDELSGRVHGISLAKRDVLEGGAGSGGLVARAQARRLLVYTWTLRPENRFLTEAFRRGAEAARWGDYEEEWAAILATGIDGIFVDHPDLGARAIARSR